MNLLPTSTNIYSHKINYFKSIYEQWVIIWTEVMVSHLLRTSNLFFYILNLNIVSFSLKYRLLKAGQLKHYVNVSIPQKTPPTFSPLETIATCFFIFYVNLHTFLFLL